jgi:ribosomal protection tetracycline resistance protein
VTDRLNLGILAHVDAGKTSLTERFLYTAGVTRQLGSVDAGTTQTDSLDQERRRGITIKAAVVSFDYQGVAVNLIDTPGHPDFIAEVERSLAVLDGAVLVVSAVEGVQAQTRVLHRALSRLGIPCVIFVNKIDRAGADPDRVLEELEQKLHIRPLALGEVVSPGSRSADFRPYSRSDPGFVEYLAAGLAEGNEEVLRELTDARSVDTEKLWQELRRQVLTLTSYPVYFGSAITGSGTDGIMAGVIDLLPKAPHDDEAPLSATVFKIDRGRAAEKIVYVRLFAGALTTRSRVEYGGRSERISGIRVFENATATSRDSAEAGQIAQVWGLNHARIGDNLGAAPARPTPSFPPPTLEAAVVPDHPADKGAVYAALTQLSDADPLISLRQGDDGATHVSLFGEVQKEVIRDTLALEFGLNVKFAATTTLYIERPLGEGSFFEEAFTPSNPFTATIGLRICPAPPGSGVIYRIAAEYGLMPGSLHTAAEEAVRETLRQGIYGWPVTDCVVTLTRAGYPTGSTPSDVRNLTPLVLGAALLEAGTIVCEPVSRFRLEIPADALAPVLGQLAKLRAVPDPAVVDGDFAVIIGDIPAGDANTLQAALPGLTSGEGSLELEFASYQPISQPVRRTRTGVSPFDRREYMMHFNRVM